MIVCLKSIKIKKRTVEYFKSLCWKFVNVLFWFGFVVLAKRTQVNSCWNWLLNCDASIGVFVTLKWFEMLLNKVDSSNGSSLLNVLGCDDMYVEIFCNAKPSNKNGSITFSTFVGSIKIKINNCRPHKIRANDEI